jgi:hypothetical protein
MKFETYKEACQWCRLQIAITKMKHEVVKTRYYSMKDDKFIDCWTVVWIRGKK